MLLLVPWQPRGARAVAVGALGEILQGKACGAGCWMSAGSRLWVLKPGAVPGGWTQRGLPGSPCLTMGTIATGRGILGCMTTFKEEI